MNHKIVLCLILASHGNLCYGQNIEVFNFIHNKLIKVTCCYIKIFEEHIY